MSGDYDKIIRENLEAVILPLAGLILNIEPREMDDLPGTLQTTIERKPDFLKKVTDQKGSTFILHIEFQTAPDNEMAFRMLEYKGMILRQHRLPVQQFVIYLGQNSHV